MAELTHLDEKLAEAVGLAQAAQTPAKNVASLARKEKEVERPPKRIHRGCVTAATSPTWSSAT